MTKTLVGILVTVVVGTALAVFGMIDAGHVLVVAAVVIAVILLWPGDGDLSHPRLPRHAVVRRPGSRRDVTDLAWLATTRDGRVSPRVMEHARALFRARLGLGWEDTSDGATSSGVVPPLSVRGESFDDKELARIGAVLGPGVARGLGSRFPPTLATLSSWLRTLDAATSSPSREEIR